MNCMSGLHEHKFIIVLEIIRSQNHKELYSVRNLKKKSPITHVLHIKLKMKSVKCEIPFIKKIMESSSCSRSANKDVFHSINNPIKSMWFFYNKNHHRVCTTRYRNLPFYSFIL